MTRLRQAIQSWRESEWVDLDDWADAADEIERLRNLLNKVIQQADIISDNAHRWLGHPHNLWGCLNELATITTIAEHAITGDWDYDPYEQAVRGE